MKDSIRRSQREHAATLAATVRRTLRQDGAGAAAPAESKARPRGRGGRIAAGIVTLAAVAAVGVAVLRPFDDLSWFAPKSVAVFEIVQGAVEARPASARQDASGLLRLQAGEPILAGTVIETRTSSARTALRLGEDANDPGASVRLDRDTRVEVVSASVLKLERGAVYIDAAAIGDAIEVRTLLGVVRDIGTQFEVRMIDEATLRVRVREGAAVLERDGTSHEATAGVELALHGDGTLTRGSVAIHGPHWDWVMRAAPIPEIEGRPLTVFLDWVTREGGWSLDFSDPATAELAAKIILHGNVRDLTAEEAAAMVLQGSDLEHELSDDGVFLVKPAG